MPRYSFVMRGKLSVALIVSAVGFVYADKSPAPQTTAPAQSYPFDWPVEKDKKYQISSTFGESRIDHFHNGIDLPGEGAKVLAPKDGRVLYRINAEITPGEMPYGGGNTLILEHGDSWTGYMHLKAFSESVLKNAPIAKGEKLGASGNTGHSGGPHLHFFIYNAGERAMLNPLLYMSDAYYKDTKPPEAKEWGVLLADKFANVNPDKSFRLSADYPVYIFLQDHGTGKERWGVFEYRVKLDGKDAIAAKFDKIFFKDDAWSLVTGQKFEDIFYRNLYALTPQIRRAKKVAVEAKDLKGNTFAKTFELKIQQN